MRRSAPASALAHMVVAPCVEAGTLLVAPPRVQFVDRAFSGQPASQIHRAHRRRGAVAAQIVVAGQSALESVVGPADEDRIARACYEIAIADNRPGLAAAVLHPGAVPRAEHEIDPARREEDRAREGRRDDRADDRTGHRADPWSRANTSAAHNSIAAAKA